jgi:hypothetical protein
MSHNATADAIDRLARDIEALTQGLNLMLDTMRSHGEMLADILDLVTVEPSDEEESPLSITLKRFIAAVENLPEQIKRAVIEGMAEAGAIAAR